MNEIFFLNLDNNIQVVIISFFFFCRHQNEYSVNVYETHLFRTDTDNHNIIIPVGGSHHSISPHSFYFQHHYVLNFNVNFLNLENVISLSILSWVNVYYSIRIYRRIIMKNIPYHHIVYIVTYVVNNNYYLYLVSMRRYPTRIYNHFENVGLMLTFINITSIKLKI